jgi:hypothetical protein
VPRKLSRGEGDPMYINDDWRIVSDELNIILQQRKVSKPKEGKPAKEYWTNEGYYYSPHHALNALVDKQIMGTGFTDLKTVCDKIDELRNMIKELPINLKSGV